MSERLSNKEQAWHQERDAKEPFLRSDEITSRIGSFEGEFLRLSGGLANDNLLIEQNKVLRIYRKNKAALTKEQRILERNWKSFRVPEILQMGDDFLLLEFVKNTPVLNKFEHGNSFGKALAEIHSNKFSTCGELGANLEVAETWNDFLGMVTDGIRSYIRDSGFNEGDTSGFDKWLEKHHEILSHACNNPVLLHADFKVSNLHWANSDQPLILDWEFSYSGPTLMDIGQLFRWGAPKDFSEGFEKGYLNHGGELDENWKTSSQVFDIVNLMGVAKNVGQKQASADCRQRIQETLKTLD